MTEMEKLKSRIDEVEKRKSDIQKDMKTKLDACEIELRTWKAKGYDLINSKKNPS